MKTDAEQRDRFELWAKTRHDMLRQPCGDYGMDYAYQTTESAWQAWQESERQAANRLEELTAGTIEIHNCIGVAAMMGETASTYAARPIGIPQQTLRVRQ